MREGFRKEGRELQWGNWGQLEDKRLFRVMYAWIDLEMPLAPRVFSWMGGEESYVKITHTFIPPKGKPGFGKSYAVHIGTVKKRYSALFEKALEQLPKEMAVRGYQDYLEEANKVREALRETKEAVNQQEE